jgi:hypothetical protein
MSPDVGCYEERYGGSGKIAFRVDHTGITLGAPRFSWLLRRGGSLGDVERIILYPVTSSGRYGSRQTQYRGIQRRQGGLRVGAAGGPVT